MTKLDIVLERVRQLPQERQDAIAAELDFMLKHGASESLLSPDQEAELARRQYISHEDVAARFEQRHRGMQDR